MYCLACNFELITKLLGGVDHTRYKNGNRCSHAVIFTKKRSFVATKKTTSKKEKLAFRKISNCIIERELIRYDIFGTDHDCKKTAGVKIYD